MSSYCLYVENEEWELFVWRILLIGTDSNYGKSTQMLLKSTQIETCCHVILQRGEGNLSALSVHMSFYKLFPLYAIDKNYYQWYGM